MSGGNKNEAGEIIFTNLKICKILQKLSRLLFCFFFSLRIILKRVELSSQNTEYF